LMDLPVTLDHKYFKEGAKVPHKKETTHYSTLLP
jgi:hypothetical protein